MLIINATQNQKKNNCQTERNIKFLSQSGTAYFRTYRQTVTEFWKQLKACVAAGSGDWTFSMTVNMNLWRFLMSFKVAFAYTF